MEKLLFEYPEECITEHVPYSSSSSFSFPDGSENSISDGDSQIELPDNVKRKRLPLPNLSEIDVVRHFTKLSRMNFGIDVGPYPLGSCTMKYNPKVNEDIARLEAFADLHPYSPESCLQGTLQLMYELEEYLKTLTGMDYFSLQAAAGSQSELIGVMITKAFYKEKKEVKRKRTKIIIPDSAHGTNPATAAMCKFETVSIPTDLRGNMNLDKFKQSLNSDIALVMLTNPNTLGLFEEDVVQISELAHENGTLMYCDGANMNAFLGITRPKDQGFDMIHLNLHKTFSTPHGGGGPGAGVLGVKSFLADYLPVPRVGRRSLQQQQPQVHLSRSHRKNTSVEDNNYNNNYYFLDFTKRKSIGKVRCFYGSFGMLVRAYSYIRAYGSNIRRVSENAVLNANYLQSSLKEVYELPYDRRCAHEFVLSCRKFGQRSALNIAKRLLDYGVHPPTIYFPLIVPEALMIEPTETESKEVLDLFASALRSIAQELQERPDIVKAAPHTTPVRRLDEVVAARKPNLRWTPSSDQSIPSGKYEAGGSITGSSSSTRSSTSSRSNHHHVT
jgi:glycine cleavage system P protein (glycine dehydrogenase) subunit 2